MTFATAYRQLILRVPDSLKAAVREMVQAGKADDMDFVLDASDEKK
jgi:hypothetical protein